MKISIPSLPLKGHESSRRWVEIHASFLQHVGRSIYPWMLKHGRDFPDPIKRPKGVRKGRLGHCYGNAAKIVTRDYHGEQRFIYCEGLAIPKGLFPMEHAWLIDMEGNTIDPTWDAATSYFGVPFNVEFVAAEARRTEHYGILNHRVNLILIQEPERCIYPVKEIVPQKKQSS